MPPAWLHMHACILVAKHVYRPAHGSTLMRLMAEAFTEDCVQEILLVEFRKQLETLQGGPLKPIFGRRIGMQRCADASIDLFAHSLSAPCHADRFYLRRFLRARQHDLSRAKAMFLVRRKRICGPLLAVLHGRVSLQSIHCAGTPEVAGGQWH